MSERGGVVAAPAAAIGRDLEQKSPETQRRSSPPPPPPTTPCARSIPHPHHHEANPASAVPADVGWASRVPTTIAPLANIRETAREWNTRSLGARVGADAVAAASAGALVAPVITMIDRGIIENASGRATLGQSIRTSMWTMLFRPHRFVFSKPFALIFTLYTGTYLTANFTDTLTSTIKNLPPATTTSGLSKFALTSTANLSLCLYKDSRFTRLFSSPSSIPRPVPGVTYSLFAFRDMLTIFASFNLPTLLAPHLPVERLAGTFAEKMSAMSAAQFIAPAAVQVVSTPLHLLGLDLYNRERVGWAERWRKVRGEWAWSCLARMGRIVPAFGVGGVVNAGVRKRLVGMVE
ncbi:hypothetical protein K402DRAFT_384224 [Aulographum hederae CBS 113979]|uniref:Sequence orphan n=1 Tax=Aulographum hederae CBS 113979 TaxID=1176131 RepID=A0A6G1GPA7_9PEZI|nr:hypothetical protein K402DRAFT_384224 [Aulographum hederae CBS 113979]